MMWTLLLLLAIVQTVSCSCPSGLTLIRDGECRGNLTRITTTWDNGLTDVTAKCNAIQAHPIIIHNEEQQAFWKELTDSKTTTILGLVCSPSSKSWVWSDGSEVDYKPSAGYDLQLKNNYRCMPGGSWYIQPNGRWSQESGRKYITTDVFCTAHLPELPAPSKDCDGFEDDEEDAMCYQIATTAQPWRDAQRLCSNFGANLAAVHSSQANSFLRRLAVSRGEVNGLYLGALGSDNKFSWIDGSEFDYSNYYPGFPVAGLGDCIVMDTQSTSGQWVNVDCSTNVSVACARPQNSYIRPACPSEPPMEGDLILSPGFPFDASTPCDYMLMVDAGKRVEVEIIMLEANSCCDRLTIYDNYFGGNVMADLSGEVYGKTYSTSSSNIVKVSWVPNGGVNVRGMMMTFRGV